MDIDLYIDFVYHGFYRLSYIEDRFKEYEIMAEAASKELDENEVILYAIYGFDEKTQDFIYANFMVKKLKIEHYAKVCSALSKTCRLFCIGNG